MFRQLVLLVSCFIVLYSPVLSFKNNVCNKWRSYYYADYTKDCYYSPDSTLSVPDQIKRHIGSSETYTVETEDGFFLDIHRLPNVNASKVILLQHCLTCHAGIWLGQDNASTALIFWKNGYDVWLGNNRGTAYGKRHRTLKPNEEEYWDFSFHEIGLYDHKPVIDFIVEKTKKPVIMIGQSMGTTSSIIYAALLPQEAKQKLRAIITLSTIAYLKYAVKNFELLSKLLATFSRLLQPIANTLRIYSLLNPDFLSLATNFFTTLPFKSWIAYVDVIFGGTVSGVDPRTFNLFLHGLSAAPLKAYYHYLQIAEANGRFQMYDYGAKKNRIIYNDTKPPLYPIHQIQTPIFTFSSSDDTISTVKDVNDFYNDLPLVAQYGQYVTDGGISHLNYHFSKYRKEKIYDPVVEIIDQM